MLRQKREGRFKHPDLDVSVEARAKFLFALQDWQPRSFAGPVTVFSSRERNDSFRDPSYCGTGSYQKDASSRSTMRSAANTRLDSFRQSSTRPSKSLGAWRSPGLKAAALRDGRWRLRVRLPGDDGGRPKTISIPRFQDTASPGAACTRPDVVHNPVCHTLTSSPRDSLFKRSREPVIPQGWERLSTLRVRPIANPSTPTPVEELNARHSLASRRTCPRHRRSLRF